MNRLFRCPPPSPSIWMVTVLALMTLLSVPGCAGSKIARFYEDPDPIVAPSATPPTKIQTKTSTSPTHKGGSNDSSPDEHQGDEVQTPSSAEEANEGPTAGNAKEKPQAAVSTGEDTSEDQKEDKEPTPHPEQDASTEMTTPPENPTPKRSLPKNANVVTPGDSVPATKPGRLQVKQNLDHGQAKPMGSIQPAPKAQPKTETKSQPTTPQKKQPENIIAPVDLAPMNPDDEALPPPPKTTGP